MAGFSMVEELPRQHQVFINYYGEDLLHGFINDLVTALEGNNINFFINNKKDRDEQVETAAWKRIEESSIALVIISMRYTESTRCMEELTKIKDCVKKGKLVAIPIFYKVASSTVASLKGYFGDVFMDLVATDHSAKKFEWKNALRWISGVKGGITVSLKSSELPRQHQVFINFFYGEELLRGFISDLVTSLEGNNINFFIDNKKDRGEQVEAAALKRIEESSIALVIISMRYTESTRCMEELKKIMDCVEKGKLVAIPIFYNVNSSTVASLKGYFGGDVFMDLVETDVKKKLEWKIALKWISSVKDGVMVPMISSKGDILKEIVKIVEKEMNKIPSEGNQNIVKENVEEDEEEVNKIPSERSQNIIKEIVKEIEKVVKKFPSQGSQKAYVDLSESQTLSVGLKELTKYERTRIFGESQYRRADLCNFFSHFVNYQGGTMDGFVENIQNLPKYILNEGTKISIDKYSEFPTCEVGAKSGSYSTSDAKTNAASVVDRTFTNFPMDSKVKPPQIQVFINFRGKQLRCNFIGYLVDALRRSEINVFVDTHVPRGEDLNILFKRIEDSGIAIVVFSSEYTESTWCLEELVKIKERVHQGLLKVLPIFYKVSPTNVKRLKGVFGDNFRDKEHTYKSDQPKIKRWKEAIALVSQKFALTLEKKSTVVEIEFVETIVKEVLKMLLDVSTVESNQASR